MTPRPWADELRRTANLLRVMSQWLNLCPASNRKSPLTERPAARQFLLSNFARTAELSRYKPEGLRDRLAVTRSEGRRETGNVLGTLDLRASRARSCGGAGQR